LGNLPITLKLTIIQMRVNELDTLELECRKALLVCNTKMVLQAIPSFYSLTFFHFYIFLSFCHFDIIVIFYSKRLKFKVNFLSFDLSHSNELQPCNILDIVWDLNPPKV
jgi:hypothetical protein